MTTFNVDFLPDSDDTNNSNDSNDYEIIDTNEPLCTIISLFDLVKCFVLSNESLCMINLIVDVIEFKQYKGMAFLKVRDETASSTAVIYKSNYYDMLKINDKIKITASVDVYRGQIQLIIRSYQKIIIKEMDNLTILKNKLLKLGYFDHKPILENDYTKIGIISSMNAAGLRDFLSIIMQRCHNKKLYIYPSSVQGKDAVEEICNAIELANRHNIVEILVMVRGGGSKEDLECFNSELVANAIHQSKIPIVTGIGHQIDTSIADLVCAKAYITPTAVAQNITNENINSEKILNKLIIDIKYKLVRYMNKQYDYLIYIEEKLGKYQDNIIVQIDEILLKNQSLVTNSKRQIISYIDNRLEYLQFSEKEIENVLFNYDHHTNNKIKYCQNHYTSSRDNIGQALQIYEEQINILSKPQILDKHNNEITSVKNLIPGKKYRICFIDGSHDLKF